MYYGDKDGNGHYSFWTDYSVGTGSGSLSITSMGKAVIGDRFVIAPGTYTTSVIGGIHDVAIVNGQGTVTFTAQMNYGNNGDSMWNVALSGNGYAGAAQGIIFSNIKGDAIFSTDKHDRGLRFYNLAFQGITGNSISFAYSSSISGPQTTYNGTEPSLKVSGLTIANTVFNSCSLGVKGSYVVNPIDNTQVIDSFDFHGNTIANLTSPGNFVDGIWTHVNFYNNSITYAGYNSQTDDVGVFFIAGSGQVHHNFMHGGRGYLARIYGMSALPNVDDIWVYDNVVLATTNYAGFDIHDEVAQHPYPNLWGKVNFHILFNTVINKTNTQSGSTYGAPVITVNNMDEGATFEFRDNIGSNLVSLGGTYMATNYTNGTVTPAQFTADTLGNVYFPATAIMAQLSDTNKFCQVAIGATIIHAGVYNAYVQTDYMWRPRPAFPTFPTFGAEEPVNAPPASSVTASAGAPQAITLPVSSVPLDGSGSTSVNSTITSYAWSEASGPNTAVLSAPNSVATNASGLIAGTYVFGLNVGNSAGQSSSATTSVTVNPAIVYPPPVSNAGANQSITLPVSAVTLTGSVSDANAPSVSASWGTGTMPSGGAPVIASPSSPVTNVSGLTVPGTYTFILKANSANGNSSSPVIVTVKPVPKSGNAFTSALTNNNTSVTISYADGTTSRYTVSKKAVSIGNSVISTVYTVTVKFSDGTTQNFQ